MSFIAALLLVYLKNCQKKNRGTQQSPFYWKSVHIAYRTALKNLSCFPFTFQLSTFLLSKTVIFCSPAFSHIPVTVFCHIRIFIHSQEGKLSVKISETNLHSVFLHLCVTFSTSGADTENNNSDYYCLYNMQSYRIRWKYSMYLWIILYYRLVMKILLPLFASYFASSVLLTNNFLCNRLSFEWRRHSTVAYWYEKELAPEIFLIKHVISKKKNC